MKTSRFQKIDRRIFLKASSAVGLGAAATFGNIGTDYPYPGEAAHDAIVKAIGRMNITDEEKAKIFSKNARRLLKLS